MNSLQQLLQEDKLMVPLSKFQIERIRKLVGEWLEDKRNEHCGFSWCDDKDCPEDANENCQTCTIDDLLEEFKNVN